MIDSPYLVQPGTRVDHVATASPAGQPGDTTSKVVLANVHVLTAGTRVEQEEQGKPMQVSTKTLARREYAPRIPLGTRNCPNQPD